jgi:hypothetical protein
VTITDFCEELHNWFDVDRIFGTFTISNGEIIVPNGYLRNNQYLRIVGSVFNDGVHQYPVSDLTDETFEGAIWAMAVPPAAIALFEKIQEWDAQYGNSAANYSPYTSETFHHYSRSQHIATNSKGEIVQQTWQGVFRKELSRFRKL